MEKAAFFNRMASLMSSYEKQYGNLTSEITFKMGRIPRLLADEKKKEIQGTIRLFDETKELLEQMSLEVEELPFDLKTKQATRMQCFKSEFLKLEKEFLKHHPRYSLQSQRSDSLSHDDHVVDYDMKQKLLANNVHLESSGRKLRDGIRTAYETQEIGSQILSDLNMQRGSLQKSRDRATVAECEVLLNIKELTDKCHT
ncbi:unnamed protein product [Protopolystoma xenopodis]|uniref:Vesicle transport v-SNARE N-terminal domain-containing protein n=1 Tax=Protopolystoma xenopodis TaxID=117903 RepID=A0A448XFU9_9PLAT|nr:unnamed protein product [Protopolystoma xenopodis]